MIEPADGLRLQSLGEELLKYRSAPQRALGKMLIACGEAVYAVGKVFECDTAPGSYEPAILAAIGKERMLEELIDDARSVMEQLQQMITTKDAK
jgi:hypothetical protein